MSLNRSYVHKLARLSGHTRYWCNRSVITRCNLAVSDMYMSVFGKDAPDSLELKYMYNVALFKAIILTTEPQPASPTFVHCALTAHARHMA